MSNILWGTGAMLAALLACAAPLHAEIPLTAVTVLGSSPRVLTFPAAATLSSLSLMPGALTLTVTHATPWPAVAIVGETDPSQAATLWVFLKIQGRWYATGAERLRPSQIAGDPKPEETDVNRWIAETWLFDTARWGPMAGYVPQTGESVGLMVVAGSTRSDDQTPVQERTKLIEFTWPGPRGARIVPIWTEGDPSTPVPVPPLPPTPPAVDLGPILTRLDNLTSDVQTLRDRLGALEVHVGDLAARPIWRTCTGRVLGIGVSCTLVP